MPRAESGAVWIASGGEEALATVKGVLYHRGGKGAWVARTLPSWIQERIDQQLAQGQPWPHLDPRLRVLLRLTAFNGAAEDMSAQLPGASVTRGQLLADAKGNVWTPTNLGLIRFDDNGKTFITEHQGLPGQWVTSMLFDREGNLWIASEGVHRLQGRLAWTAHTRRQKLPSDTVWNLARSRDGILWAGTNRGLAQAYEKQWEVLPGTEERSLYASAQDAQGNFWVGGNNAKDAANSLLLRVHGTGFVPVALTGLEGPSTVNAMDFGPDGALYLGTQAHGLHRLAREGKDYRTRSVTLPGGDPKEQIDQVLRDRAGRLWVSGMVEASPCSMAATGAASARPTACAKTMSRRSRSTPAAKSGSATGTCMA
ncbi:hypothetical protein LP420_30470 [Massilia sp. B-10]|nr:hypothetical protein LP420_30470 [Massilia sp. B-10]